MSVGKNIARFRRENGMTQAELGELLGVSNQAVSKWESETTMPDILLLPALADVFGCSIDGLFREQTLNLEQGLSGELPWEDDNVIRGVVFQGRKILKVTDSPVGSISFEISGDAFSVSSETGIVVRGNVLAGCVSYGNISVQGSITGECVAQGDISAGSWILGECVARNITAGSIAGACTAEHISTPSGTD